MAMLLLRARRLARSATFSVHLDTTKTITGGLPDPAWVYTQSWDLPTRIDGETTAAYTTRLAPWIASVKVDLRVLADAALAEAQDRVTGAGTAIAGEGQAF